jgi:endonuclease/exonuclease/phosphatase family metal-dependent hydrolase
MCVYMPTDGGGAESVENYAETCANLTALIAESDAVHFVIAGDFNCRNGSRLFRLFQKLVDDNSLCMSDLRRLNKVFTYFNDGGTSSTWIDHVLCSQVLDSLVCSNDVLYDYVSSDHKPLLFIMSEVMLQTALYVQWRI